MKFLRMAFSIFPEMSICGYWQIPKMAEDDLRRLAEPLDGRSLSRVVALSTELQIGIGAGWLEVSREGCLYHAYRVFMPDGSGHTHRNRPGE